MSDAKPSPSGVGIELKRRRQQLKLTLTQVELATKIRGKYLTAIESGAYDGLPNDIYSRGFVQKYAEYLELDAGVITDRYVIERGGLSTAATATPRLERPRRLVVTGRLATVGTIGLIIIMIGSYLALQFSSLAAPPDIVITSPAANQTITGTAVTVSGRVTAGADVAIDDVSVVSDADGNFSSTLSLKNGLNTIRVSARSKLGKSDSESRSVLVHAPEETATASQNAPTAQVPGIAVLVTAKRNIAVSVSLDGTTTKQIITAGSNKLYQGTADVNLTTSDAGATSLTITNQVMVGKKIPSLGGDGEMRTGQDFTPTTNLP